MRTRHRPGIVGLCALVLALAACTTSIPRSSPTPTPTVHTGSDTLAWTSCHDSYQCATLSVPLDWSRPNGKHIDLAIIRKRTTGSNPIGSVVLNPGGPGEPGTTFLTQLIESGSFPKQLSGRFNVVSWDPRGTGASSGVACLTVAELTAPDPLPYPPTKAGRVAVAAKQVAQQNRCLRRDGSVITHVGTIQTVHDLDAIRAALGDAKLTYVGFSYGTAIGLEYLRLFGGHVRAMVLDGIDLPGADPVAMTRAQMASFEANLNRFLADCKADPSCVFGNGHPQKALIDFLDSLEKGRRIPASYTLPDNSGKLLERKGTLGYTEAVTGIAAALYNQQTWTTLRGGLAAATRADQPDGHLLLALRDLLGGRQLDGSWNHSSEAQLAISCADQRERATNFFGDPNRIATWSKALPVFGAFGAVGLPGCYKWPSALQPLDALRAKDLAHAPAVVLVNSAHDPATPYANAKKAKTLLPDTRLVTWGGDDHTSFAGGHHCIDAAVVPYLVSLQLPGKATRCSPSGD